MPIVLITKLILHKKLNDINLTEKLKFFNKFSLLHNIKSDLKINIYLYIKLSDFYKMKRKLKLNTSKMIKKVKCMIL